MTSRPILPVVFQWSLSLDTLVHTLTCLHYGSMYTFSLPYNNCTAYHKCSPVIVWSIGPQWLHRLMLSTFLVPDSLIYTPFTCLRYGSMYTFPLLYNDCSYTAYQKCSPVIVWCIRPERYITSTFLSLTPWYTHM